MTFKSLTQRRKKNKKKLATLSCSCYLASIMRYRCHACTLASSPLISFPKLQAALIPPAGDEPSISD